MLRSLLAALILVFAGCGNTLEHAASKTDAGSRDRDAGGDSAVAQARTDSGPSEASAAVKALALPQARERPADATNRFADDAAAARLGRTVFFDGFMSGQLLDGDNDGSKQALGQRGDTGKVACASCHVPESYFSDSRSLRQQISLGAGWGRRRAPSLLDVAHSRLLMWDGRRDTFYNQIFGVIENPVEMNSSRLFAAQQVFAKYRAPYEALFGPMPPLDDKARFPALSADRTGCSKLNPSERTCSGALHGVPGDAAEYDGMTRSDQEAVTRVVVNVGKALGAYERLLECGESRFDRWARGEDAAALSASERRGAELFVGKAKCVQCHSGAYLSDEKFHNVGLKPELVATVFIDMNDRGASVGLADASADPLNSKGIFSDGDDDRLPMLLDSKAEGAFRTPKLRCLSKRPSFMHTAHLRTVQDVVAFFDRGGDAVGYPGTNELEPLGLSESERADVVAFLLSLDGAGPSAELMSP